MILSIYQRGIAYFGGLVDTDAPAKGPPPRTLWPFMGWCVRGAWHVFLTLAIAASSSNASAQSSPWQVGRPAPHVHLPDIDTGDPVDLADFRGKKVLLAEFASW